MTPVGRDLLTGQTVLSISTATEAVGQYRILRNGVVRRATSRLIETAGQPRERRMGRP